MGARADGAARVAAVAGAAVALLGALALVRAEVGSLDPWHETLAVLGTAPLLFGIFALVDPGARAWLRGLGAWAPYAVAALATGCLLLIELATTRVVNPFALVATALGSWAIAGALGEGTRRSPVLGPVEVLALLALGLPLDARWYEADFQEKFPGDYGWWALVVAFVALASWGALRESPVLGWRPPKKRDLAVALVALAGLAAVLVPVGLATGFLETHGPRHDAREIALEVVGTLVTIALPEEVLFRGVLDGGLRAGCGRPLASLVVSSLLFGLWHWPRETHLPDQLAYVGFASVAGVVYALAYRKADGLPAAVLVHTLVDVTWLELLHKK